MRKAKTIGMCMILLVGIILTSIFVSAIGITPARTTLDFKEEFKQDIKFTIMNNEHKAMKVLITLDGEMAQYIKLNKLLIEFNADEESKEVILEMKLPNKIDNPGEHEALITLTDLPADLGAAEGSYIGARTAVIHQVRVKVPYPGKYAEARLDIDDAESQGIVNFLIPVKNLGEEDILHASAIVEVQGPTGKIIGKAQTDDTQIKSQQTKELVASWKADVDPGEYHAIVTVTYDGKTTKIEKNFHVGSSSLEVKDVNVKNFKLGGVAKFNIVVSNKLTTPLDDLYAQLIITNENGDVIADVNSAVVVVDTQQDAVLNAFWDTEGVTSGIYNAKVVLHYANGQTTETLMKTEVTLDAINNNLLSPTAQVIANQGLVTKQSSIFMIAIFALIAINIGWLVYVRRLKNRNKLK